MATLALPARLQFALLCHASRQHCTCRHLQADLRKLVSSTATQPTIQDEVDDIRCFVAADDVIRNDPGTQRDEPVRRHSAVLKGWLVPLYRYY